MLMRYSLNVNIQTHKCIFGHNTTSTVHSELEVKRALMEAHEIHVDGPQGDVCRTAQ